MVRQETQVGRAGNSDHTGKPRASSCEVLAVGSESWDLTAWGSRPGGLCWGNLSDNSYHLGLNYSECLHAQILAKYYFPFQTWNKKTREVKSLSQDHVEDQGFETRPEPLLLTARLRHLWKSLHCAGHRVRCLKLWASLLQEQDDHWVHCWIGSSRRLETTSSGFQIVNAQMSLG